MKVSVKLISMATAPPEGFDAYGKAEIKLDDGTSVTGLIDRLPLNTNETFLVLVNGDTVAPSERDRTPLADGDDVAIFPPMQGGRPV